MDGRQLAEAVYAKVDALDAVAFANYLTTDCKFYFGNAPVVEGRDTVLSEVGEFFSAIGGIEHNIQDLWEDGDTIIIRLLVSFERKDGQSVGVPTVNIWRRAGNEIAEYRIYSDQTPVFD